MSTAIEVAVLVALIWKAQQLLRDPHDPALRVVVLNLAFVAVGNLAIGPLARLLPIGGGKLIQNVFLLLGLYLLLCFFLYATRSNPGRRIRWELVPVVVVAAVMTTAFVLATPAERAFRFDDGHAGLATALFFIAGNVYFGYNNIVCIYLAVTAARISDRHPAIGLRLAALGLFGAMLTLPCARVFEMAIRLAGGEVPAAVRDMLGTVSSAALIVFLVGLCWPGLVNRSKGLARQGVLWRRYRQLRPLRRFIGPILTLRSDHAAQASAATGPWLWRSGVRRWAECRDGLVLASAYVSPDRPVSRSVREQAAQLGAAIEAYLGGQQMGEPTPRFAIPGADTFDADLNSLVGLSDAVGRLPRSG